MQDYIEKGLREGYIRFVDETRKQIIYIYQDRPRNYTNPEEQVQAETFLRLIFDYNYPVERIRQFVPVKMGRDIKEADIIIYNDTECTQPLIIVECKRQDISEAEFIQAIEQGVSYCFATAKTVKYLWVTSGLKNSYFEVNKEKQDRRTIARIPRFGENEAPKYSYVKGGDINGKQTDLIEVSEDVLTRCFRKAHDILWEGGKRDESEAFDELDKLLFCKIWDERKLRKNGEPYDFQIFTEKDDIITNKTLYQRVIALYNEGKVLDPNVFAESIKISPEVLHSVVELLQGINLNKTDLDCKGRAFETFMGAFFRGKFGQFFTPRPIVKFIVDVLPITHTSKVLDTSCGSGGFLLYALDKVRKEANEYYQDGTSDHFRHWHDFAEKQLFGIELNEKISRTAKMNMILHDDGHTNVISADGLLPDVEQMKQNKGFKYGTFDFIITNPPFGSTVKRTERAYMKLFKVAHKRPNWLDIQQASTPRDNQSTEVLFIEQAYQYLKEGAFLAIVIPDGILTNSSLQYVREEIEEWFRIVAVVSLPQTAFSATGAAVKSSILFLRKWYKNEQEQIVSIKNDIELDLIQNYEYRESLKKWEEERKAEEKVVLGELKQEFNNKTISEIKKTDEYKSRISTIIENYTHKLGLLKNKLNGDYRLKKQKKLPNYSIFMAIAEDIGYDAAGKPTGNNELEIIGRELRKFITKL